MIVTKTSLMSMKESSMDLDITEEQMYRIENRRKTGEYIQDIVPNLSKEEREFLISGYTIEEQKMLFG